MLSDVGENEPLGQIKHPPGLDRGDIIYLFLSDWS